jgi:hypothetical protein
MPRTKPARGKAILAGAVSGSLLLLGVTAASAISVLLPPGASLLVPSTTAVTEPTMDGFVIHDALVPFSIKTASGAVLCEGKLHDRVVQSDKTGQLDFYYAIRGTKGPGAINRLFAGSFSGQPLRVAYRTDGLGTVQPITAVRSAAPGAEVEFTLLDPPVSCAEHQESRFMLIRTDVKTFQAGGKARIIATTGAIATVPIVMP